MPTWAAMTVFANLYIVSNLDKIVQFYTFRIMVLPIDALSITVLLPISTSSSNDYIAILRYFYILHFHPLLKPNPSDQ